MIYVKAAAVGVLGALLFAVVWVIGAILFAEQWQRRQGGIGAVSLTSDSALLAAVVGFVVSFGWFVRR